MRGVPKTPYTLKAHIYVVFLRMDVTILGMDYQACRAASLAAAGNSLNADELLNECFLNLHDFLKRHPDREVSERYFFKMLWREASRMKKESVKRPAGPLLPDAVEDEALEGRIALDEALKELPAAAQEVLLTAAEVGVAKMARDVGYNRKSLTKIYKENLGILKENMTKHKKNHKMGLGDKVEEVLKASGIDRVAQAVAGTSGCGCEKRRELLNNLTLNSTPPRGCMSLETKKEWGLFLENRGTCIEAHQQELICKVIAEVWHLALKPCASCGGRVWAARVAKIDKYYTEIEAK